MTDRTSPETETLPEWEDADVQLVYEMLCDPELNSPPNPEEHWEGWVSRNIVRGLRSRRYAQTPALAIENDQLRRTIQLHAGDAMSLSNELDEWRERALAAEAALSVSSTLGNSK